MVQTDGFGFWEIVDKEGFSPIRNWGVVDKEKMLFYVTDQQGIETGKVLNLNYFWGWEFIKEQDEEETQRMR